MLNIIVRYPDDDQGLALEGSVETLNDFAQLLNALETRKEDFEDTLFVPDEPVYPFDGYCTKIRIEPSRNWITTTDKWGTHEIPSDKLTIDRQDETLFLRGNTGLLVESIKSISRYGVFPGKHAHVDRFAFRDEMTPDSLDIIIYYQGD